MRYAVERCMVASPRSVSDDTVMAEFEFPTDFIGFAGHFPGNPILPAVVHVIMAQVVVDAHERRRTELTQISRAKFLNSILPGQRVCVKVTDKNDGLYAVDVADTSGAVVSRFQFSCHVGRPEEPVNQR